MADTKVQLRHPVTGREMAVRPVAVALWEKSGWVRVTPLQDDTGAAPGEVRQGSPSESASLAPEGVVPDGAPGNEETS